MKNKIIVITGPTGVGKTKMSIELAKTYNAEIINADSVQIYKELNIGSAKIKEEEKENIKHHLFDIKKVNEEYSVYDYQKDLRNKIKEIFDKNKNVILVGGTGLYISAGLYNYEFSKNNNKNNYEDKTNEELYNMLDDKSIHINNRQRLISKLNNNNNVVSDKLLYDCIFIGLTTKRDNLYNIINNRVDIMFNCGLEEEVRNLYNKYGCTKILSSAIGYKEFIPYFNNDISLEEVINNIKQNSRKYAKRQYTWFNNKLELNWFIVNYENFDDTIKDVKKYIKELV